MSNYRTIDLGRYATMFKALSNPHRLQIYTILAGCCEAGSFCATNEMLTCCVGDLDEKLDIASSTLSHHLKELSQADLVNMKRSGKHIYCSINPAAQVEIGHLFVSHSNSVLSEN